MGIPRGRSKAQGAEVKTEAIDASDSMSVKSERSDDQTVPCQEMTHIKDELRQDESVVPCASSDSSRDSVDFTQNLTPAMIREQEEIQKTLNDEELKAKKENEEVLRGLSGNGRQQQFNRLEFILNKSNAYITYLTSRMETQEEEKKKREENRKARAAKKAKNVTKVQSPVKRSSRIGARATTSGDSSNTSPKGRRKASSLKQTGTGSKPPTLAKRGRKRKSPASDENLPDSEDQNAKKAREDLDNDPENAREEPDSDPENAREEPDSDSEVEEDVKKEPRYFNGEQISELQPELFTGGRLRDYQIEGFIWLKTMFENGINGILADEMGLGKTAQSVAGIADLAGRNVPGPFLVVAPLSTLPNWVSEFARFTPQIPVLLYHGSKDEREKKRSKIWRPKKDDGTEHLHPVVITSYEMVISDRRFIGHFPWKYLIIDEGHRLKNFQCRLIKELKMYNTSHRLLLTGTPLQNNLSELWSLLNFLLPEIFDDLGSFEAWLDVETLADDDQILEDERRHNVLSMLHQILTPFMLRRLKCDVDLDIPPKRELLVYAPLTNIQKEFYQATVDKSILKLIDKKNETQSKVPVERVEYNAQGRPVRKRGQINYGLMMSKKENDNSEDGDIDEWVEAIVKQQQLNKAQRAKVKSKVPKTSETTVRLQNTMMQLRKCVNHPYLLDYPLDDNGDYLINEDLVRASGKLMLLDRMLVELKRRGHKVLVFSQMVKMLDIIDDFCSLRGYEYCRLDGSRSMENRQEQIAKFNEDPESFVFLISTRAGGLGINLVAADTVIIYDSDWNPQADLQAQDRCHRIGQTKPVVVYRLVTKNTIDQKIVEKAAEKRKLEKMVIHKGKFKSGMKNFTDEITPLSAEELQTLLKSRDHVTCVEGREGNVISPKDLDTLLDRTELYKAWKNNVNGPTVHIPKSSGKKKSKKTAEEYHDVVGAFKIIDGENESKGLHSIRSQTVQTVK